MFECVLDGLLLKKVVESIKEVCTDVNLVCTERGIQLQAMDNAHVALLYLRLAHDFFLKYRCDSEITLGISLPTLMKALQPIKNEGTRVQLATSKDVDDDNLEESILHIFIEEMSTGDSWSIVLNLLDIEVEQLNIPESIYAANATLDSKVLNELLKYFHSVSESLTIKIDRNSITLSATGENLQVSRRMNVTDMEYNNPSGESSLEQDFACRYLSMFMKASTLSPRVFVHAAAGIPVKITFPLGSEDGSRRASRKDEGDFDLDGNEDDDKKKKVKKEKNDVFLKSSTDEDDSQLTFYLAPKLED